MTDETNKPEGVKLYPAWRQALADLEAADLKPGQVLDRASLEKAFGIEKAKNVDDYVKNESLFQTHIWKLRNEMVGLGDYRPRFGRFEVVEAKNGA